MVARIIAGVLRGAMHSSVRPGVRSSSRPLRGTESREEIREILGRCREPGPPGVEPERRRTLVGVSSEALQPDPARSLDLPVDELLRRARPLPSRDEMVIDDLTEEEGAAFLAVLEE